jgi:L-rhamnose mutarotase
MLYDIDWNNLILGLPLEQGDAKVPGKKFYQNTDGRFDEIINKWQLAGYESSDSVEWINYYPVTHFDNSVVDQLATAMGLSPARSWISRIRPGKMAPYHKDIDDNIEKYLQHGPIERYSIFISKPSLGAVFLLKDQIYHLQTQGTTIKWDNYMDWHAGVNCGFEDKFMFHFLGTKNVK